MKQLIDYQKGLHKHSTTGVQVSDLQKMLSKLEPELK